MSDADLFDDFPQVSAKQWKQKIQFDLKGADYNDTLVWESPEGIKVKPFYHAEDLKTVKGFELSKNHNWKIAQSIFAGDSQRANEKAKDCLKRGAESLVVTIPNKKVDLETLLSGIDVELVPIHFNFEFLDTEYIEMIRHQLEERKSSYHLNLDVIGNLARSGNWFHNLKKDFAILTQIHEASLHQEGKTIGVDISLYQNAGATMIQQLAYGLAQANEYLNRFTKDAPETAISITFKVAVSGNYFFEIAKLRALRWLWQSVTEAYGIHQDCHILAYPSKRNKTLYDYNTNMLRTTSECMSAILGGADTVYNLSYDSIYHKDNEFGERIARNQLLLLKEESYFHQGSNMAEGSYYIASLTQQLAEKALVLFKQIENSGGLLDELKKGVIQQKIKESSEKEQLLFDTNKIVAVGTNAFQNKEDRMKHDLELYPFVKNKPRKTIIVPLIERRLSEKLEQKRLEDE